MVLFGVLGIGPLVAVALALRRHALAPAAAFGVGVALMVWLAVEIALIGYTNEPPLQPFYIVLGTAIVVVGLGWLLSVSGLNAAAARRMHLRP
jgi:hypothetical protein